MLLRTIMLALFAIIISGVANAAPHIVMLPTPAEMAAGPNMPDGYDQFNFEGVAMDGSLIYGRTSGHGKASKWFIWDPEYGANLADAYLTDNGVEIPDGWWIARMDQIAEDGSCLMVLGCGPDSACEQWLIEFNEYPPNTVPAAGPALLIVSMIGATLWRMRRSAALVSVMIVMLAGSAGAAVTTLLPTEAELLALPTAPTASSVDIQTVSADASRILVIYSGNTEYVFEDGEVQRLLDFLIEQGAAIDPGHYLFPAAVHNDEFTAWTLAVRDNESVWHEVHVQLDATPSTVPAATPILISLSLAIVAAWRLNRNAA